MFFFITLLVVILLVAISVMLIGVRVFFTKEKQFPNTHIGKNAAMKTRGISCVKTQDIEERNKKNIFDITNSYTNK